MCKNNDMCFSTTRIFLAYLYLSDDTGDRIIVRQNGRSSGVPWKWFAVETIRVRGHNKLYYNWTRGRGECVRKTSVRPLVLFESTRRDQYDGVGKVAAAGTAVWSNRRKLDRRCRLGGTDFSSPAFFTRTNGRDRWTSVYDPRPLGEGNEGNSRCLTPTFDQCRRRVTVSCASPVYYDVWRCRVVARYTCYECTRCVSVVSSIRRRIPRIRRVISPPSNRGDLHGRDGVYVVIRCIVIRILIFYVCRAPSTRRLYASKIIIIIILVIISIIVVFMASVRINVQIINPTVKEWNFYFFSWRFFDFVCRVL